MTSARPDTWMPLYIGDYLADTAHLNCKESGAYLHLIMAYWRRGSPLPNDDEYLSRVCKLSGKEWRYIKDVVSAFFIVSTEHWTHKRIDRELQSSCNAYAKRAAAARKRWCNADAMHEQPQPQPQSSPDGEDKPPVSPLAEQPTDDDVIDLTPPEDLDRRPSHAGRERKTDIAAWEPDERDCEYAEAHGLDAGRILEDIRGWAANAPPAKRQKRDPRAFWQGWCRRDADRLGGARRANGAAARPEPPSFIAAVRDVLDGGEMEPGAEP